MRCNNPAVAAETDAVALLVTALVLGLRHGIDWDHIAAITDITSSTDVAEHAEEHHELEHQSPAAHAHTHGGADEFAVHGQLTEPAAFSPADPPAQRFGAAQRRPILLGTLYAFGHGAVVIALGSLALIFGAKLPDWVDPIMSRVVGLTLVILGVWVFVSLYNYVRHGGEFRLRSRWMLVFDGVRHAWRRFQASLHGHEHVEPMEMSSYGPRTAFTVGAIHGVGAETATQVLLITAIGGAATVGLGLPMMLAFVFGLIVSNTIIVVISASGFLATRSRQAIYVAIGIVAGFFSLVVGAIFLFGLEGVLPAIGGG
jgi:high-affinity nickel-transport protein